MELISWHGKKVISMENYYTKCMKRGVLAKNDRVHFSWKWATQTCTTTLICRMDSDKEKVILGTNLIRSWEKRSKGFKEEESQPSSIERCQIIWSKLNSVHGKIKIRDLKLRFLEKSKEGLNNSCWKRWDWISHLQWQATLKRQTRKKRKLRETRGGTRWRE